MKIDEMLPSKFLKQSDVDGEAVVTVTALKKMNVALPDAPAELKFVIQFAEYKPMVLNATNVKRLFKALGPETEDWIGRQMILFVDENVEYAGNVTGGLRLKALPPASRPSRRVAVTGPSGDSFENDVPFE
jgi:hypothetical protein